MTPVQAAERILLSGRKIPGVRDLPPQDVAWELLKMLTRMGVSLYRVHPADLGQQVYVWAREEADAMAEVNDHT